MVGMGAQEIHEESLERDSVCEESLEPCVKSNESVSFHLKDSGSPTTNGSEGNVKGVALCPITPISCRENGDSVFVSSSPLSVESPPLPNVDGLTSPKNEGVALGLKGQLPNVDGFSLPRNEEGVALGLNVQLPNVDSFSSPRNEEVVALGLDGSPRTPNEGVFDPFAPGPDEMLLAPICKKLVKESRRIVARRLNFDDCDDFPISKGVDDNVDTLSEKLLLESVYESLLEAIILKQSEEFFAENQPLELEGLDTPTSPPPLMGVAETCPGAPMKAAASKSRNIDAALCRKLEF